MFWKKKDTSSEAEIRELSGESLHAVFTESRNLADFIEEALPGLNHGVWPMTPLGYSQFFVELIMLHLCVIDKCLFHQVRPEVRKQVMQNVTKAVAMCIEGKQLFGKPLPKFINTCSWNDKIKISGYYRGIEAPKTDINISMSIFDPSEELSARCAEYGQCRITSEDNPQMEGSVYERLVENIVNCWECEFSLPYEVRKAGLLLVVAFYVQGRWGSEK